MAAVNGNDFHELCSFVWGGMLLDKTLIGGKVVVRPLGL